MTVKRTKSVSLEELWNYEAAHPVVFASPRALAEARLIADMNQARRNRRRHSRSNGVALGASRRKLAAA